MIEQANGKLNLAALTDKLKGSGGDQPKPAGDKDQAVRVVIDQLDVTNASVAIRPGIPGLEPEYRVTLPSVSLKNVGNATNGDSVGKVLQEVAATLAAKAADNDKVPASVRQLLSLDFTNLEGQAKEKLQNATEKLDQKLGDLLGGKKKK
ncbi:MAG: hypothetical protein QM754_16855 [Tepidisphaeraceae bacterium]